MDIVTVDGEIFVEADSLIKSVQTDEEGQSVFEAVLPLGGYYVKEIEVSEILIIVEISKSDVTTGRKITGAKLKLLDEYGDVY